MRYYMPTIILEDDDIVLKSGEVFAKYGKKALIVTGRSSAKICGALDDVINTLSKEGISYKIFDKVLQNPNISLNADGAKIGMDCDFVIGIGGGSPLDTAKGIAVLIKNGTDNYKEKLFGAKDYDNLPVIAIPTTAGTGSEVTPYSIFTDDELKTKTSMARRVFPEYALIDIKYFMFMPYRVRVSTMMDAYSHAVESFINTKSTPYSEIFALNTMRNFAKNKAFLLNETMDKEVMAEYVRASSFAGMAISQTGTSLPHTLGYPITYNFGIPHGIANTIFLEEFFKISPKSHVEKVLESSGFESIDAAGKCYNEIVTAIVDKPSLSAEQIAEFSAILMSNKNKLANHPAKINLEQIVSIYKKALK